MNVSLEIGSKDNNSNFKARIKVDLLIAVFLPGNIVLLPEARIDDG